MAAKKLPWFRMYVDFLEDPKMVGIAFEDQRHFIGVLALKSSGIIDQECREGMKDRIVAQRLWIDHAIINDVKRRLIDAGLIDEGWQPLGWSNHKPESNRLPSHIWRALREAIFKRDDYTCAYCGKRGVKLECDHIVPVAKGGHNGEDNLITACFKCNRSKRDKMLSDWMA